MNSTTVNLNQTHHVIGTTNKFLYKLPSTSYFTKNDTISLQEISIYNSFFNITSTRGNNTLSIIWNANTSITYNFTLPDCFLDMPGLNDYIKQQCILNNLYMIETSTGKFVQFITLSINQSRYATEFFISPLPTAAQATALGYTIPSAASWTLPATAKSPQIVISSSIGDLMGFNLQTIPAVIQSADYEQLSDKTPQIVNSTNILIGCNLINNQYSNPSTLLTAVPVNGDFGSLLYFSNASAHYTNLNGGQYDQIEITLYDQYNKPLEMNDFNCNILLNLKRNI